MASFWDQVSNLPEFEQPIARGLQVVRGNEPDTIAHTESTGNKVFVDDPSRMDAPTMAHEVMHKIQQRAGNFSNTPNNATQGYYSYGGLKGLQSLGQQGGTIAKLNPEQQADIPRDYMAQRAAWAKGPITQKVLQQSDEVDKAYAPFIRQEAAMAAPGINVTPAAPGPPPAALTGMMKPLPEVGGSTLNASPQQGQNGTSYDVGPKAGRLVPGLLQRGNIDVNHRPQIHNADGSMSSIFSMTIPVDKDGSVWSGDYAKAPAYALVPSIANGKFLTPDGKLPDEHDKKAMGQLEDAATDYYSKTRQHLGMFSSSSAADKYAGATHAWGNDGTNQQVYAPSYTGDSNTVINPGPNTAAPAGTPGGVLPSVPGPPNPIYATHQDTGHRIMSADGGKSWQPAQ